MQLVCCTQATVWVLVEPGARPATRGLGRVGHVHDHQLAATGVGVLDVAGLSLDEVDADQREAAYLAVGVGALPAVHRLVLELQRREYAGQRGPRRRGDVVDPDRVQVGLHEQWLGLHEAPGDARRGRVARGQRDVVAGDQRDVLVGAEQLALLGDPVAVIVCLRRRAGQDRAGEEGDRRGGRQDAHDRPNEPSGRGVTPPQGLAEAGRVRFGQLCASEASRAAWSTDSVATAARASFSCWSLDTSSFEVCHALTEGAILSCQAVCYPRVGADRVAEKRLGHACPFQGARGRPCTGRLQESHACPACIKWRAVLALVVDQPARRRRGAGWQTGQKNDERFMKVTRRIGVPQREQGSASRP